MFVNYEPVNKINKLDNLILNGILIKYTVSELPARMSLSKDESRIQIIMQQTPEYGSIKISVVSNTMEGAIEKALNSGIGTLDY